MRSIVFFTIIVILKTISEFSIRYYHLFEENEQIYFVQPALDVFELVLTLYTLYCTLLFCSCLTQGLIYEYQPVSKFGLIAAMAFAVVIQRFIIECCVSVVAMKELSIDEQRDKAV